MTMDKKYTKAQIVEVINELTRHHENYKNQIYKLIDALRAVLETKVPTT